jgi:hypothetical protein
MSQREHLHRRRQHYSFTFLLWFTRPARRSRSHALVRHEASSLSVVTLAP